MLLAISQAAKDTLGLVGVFFVFFPILVNILIVFAIAQVLGERQENEEFKRTHPI